MTLLESVVVAESIWIAGVATAGAVIANRSSSPSVVAIKKAGARRARLAASDEAKILPCLDARMRSTSCLDSIRVAFDPTRAWSTHCPLELGVGLSRAMAGVSRQSFALHPWSGAEDHLGFAIRHSPLAAIDRMEKITGKSVDF